MKNRFAIVALLTLALTGCYDSQQISRDSTQEPAAKSQAEEVLEANGYTDIELTGYAMFSCSDDDTFKTGFRAKSPAGQQVKGAVCSGWFKGATIRLN
ncbi:hypothetical protein [Stenotrophomonas phage BUCT608]|nr:hypothetical protein [Stenotrophomonas phage BUCT608]QYC97593.1 hypothetical protein [Stenotrophomonas phage BUCT608]